MSVPYPDAAVNERPKGLRASAQPATANTCQTPESDAVSAQPGVGDTVGARLGTDASASPAKTNKIHTRQVAIGAREQATGEGLPPCTPE